MVQPRQAQIDVDHHVPTDLVLVPHVDQDQLSAGHHDGSTWSMVEPAHDHEYCWMLQAVDWTWPMVQPALHDDCWSMLTEVAHMAWLEVNEDHSPGHDHQMMRRCSQTVDHVLHLDHAYNVQ